MDEDSANKKGWRRFRRLKIEKGTIRKRARKIESATLKHAHRFLTRRWTNARDVSRNTISWLIGVGVLIALASLQLVWFSDAYTVQAPAAGGAYAEGMVGRLETMNPLFASTPAEVSAVGLVFSGLLRYDTDNQLQTDVADRLTVSDDQKVYDVTLRSDVYWHDGQRLTADDVVFTVHLMQDITVKAQQYGSWVGVRVEKVSDNEVKFILPEIYAPFAQSLTFSILPQHILKDVRPSDLRENNFGRAPVGTGPFVFSHIQLINPDKDELVAHFDANAKFYRGKPLLARFQIHTYKDRDMLKRALLSSEVNAALGLGVDQIASVSQRGNLTAATNPLSDGMFAIFNNDSPALKDAQVRQALVLGTDRKQVLKAMYGRGIQMGGPLPDALVSNTVNKQPAFDIKAATAKLDAAGWKLVGLDREKDGVKLELHVIAPDSGDYKLLLNELTRQWKLLGVTVTTELASPDTIVSDVLQPRNYDVLVYELAIGADADVYSYWHSSQANARGLNFANYRSGLADDALSSARARSDPTLRAAKYKTFYDQWVKEAPAIALYQPLLSYVSNMTGTNIESNEWVANAVTRYRDVERWSIANTTVMTTP